MNILVKGARKAKPGHSIHFENMITLSKPLQNFEENIYVEAGEPCSTPEKELD